MINKPFVPDEFKVPAQLETERLCLRMLSISDVVKDYDAVMSSEAYLLSSKPFGPKQKWPKGLTIAQNLVDLGWHHKEFQMRTSFAYTVIRIDESECLGCVYIEPTQKLDFDAKVCLWVRQSQVDNGLDRHLFDTVKKWLSALWPFKKVAFPGREIAWAEWQQ